VADNPRKFDPLGLLATLDRHRVAYIVIGAFARVIHGADEVTRGVDIVPSTKPDNLQRLEAALGNLNAEVVEGLPPTLAAANQPVTLETDHGELKVVPEPAGTRGYEDIRRAATREPLGRGVRPAVASVNDLARMLAAVGREEDRPKLRAARQLAELERGLTPEL